MSAQTAIIGAGAAGLMAALWLSEAGIACDVYEKKDRCGLKLGITGKGRCNLTNHCTPEQMRVSVLSGQRFLYSALARYDAAWLMDFFESRGLKLKTERGNRVFPASERALDVVGFFLKNQDKRRIKIVHEEITEITHRRHFILKTIAGREHTYKTVLIATGGLSYPQTGSTGDGYAFAVSLGHSLTPCRPSLTGLCCAGGACAAMQGLSLKNVTLTLTDPAGKKLYSEMGEVLFTHFGLSGPLALTASAHMAKRHITAANVQIDFKPGLSREKLDARLVREFSGAPNKSLKNTLLSLLPASAVPVMTERCGIRPDTPVHSVTREGRAALVSALKGFGLEVTGLRPIEEAVITAGGVMLSEINPKTMESRLAPGLFFAGEVLDVDALTGGFNLHIAFATAAAAAVAIIEENL